MGAQPVHPGELVGELLGADRIAVGQIERGDGEPVDLGLDIAAVGVVGVAGQPRPPQPGRRAGGQDGDAVEPLLAVPDAVIAGGAKLQDREGLVGALHFLEAEHVRLLLGEIFEQPRQPGANAVQIVGDDLHRGAQRLEPRKRVTDREAGAAAAARGGIGVGDLEGGAAEALDKSTGRAADQVERHLVDDQGHAVARHRQVVGGDLVGQAEAVLEAGAAAALDRQAQDRRLALALGDRGDPRRGARA